MNELEKTKVTEQLTRIQDTSTDTYGKLVDFLLLTAFMEMIKR